MRESVGASTLMKIVMVFIFLYVVIMAIAINYSTAFRIKNNIISIIENYEGIENAESVIKDYVQTVSYVKSSIKDVNITNCDPNTNNYCIRPLASGTGKTYYRVTVYLRFGFPLVGNIIQFPVSGETKPIDYYGGAAPTAEEQPDGTQYIDECFNGATEFISWKCDSFCIGTNVDYNHAIQANYRTCVDGSWVTKHETVSPNILATVGDGYKLTYIFNKGSINERKETTLYPDTCNSKANILVPSISTYVECGAGAEVSYDKKTFTLKSNYIPSNTPLRELDWKVTKGNEYINITGTNNPAGTCPFDNLGASSANVKITDKAIEELKTKPYLETAVTVTNKSNVSTTCNIKIKGDTPTCEVVINKKGVTLNYVSGRGIKDYGLSTVDEPIYNYSNTTPVKEGSKTIAIKSANSDTYYGYVKDISGNTGKCSGPEVTKTKSRTVTVSYQCTKCSGCKSCADTKDGTHQCSKYTYSICLINGRYESGAGGCYKTTCSETKTEYYCDSGYVKLSDKYCVRSTDIALTLDEQGGSDIEYTDDTNSCIYMGNLKLPSAITREGYTFNGWRLYDGTSKAAGATVKAGCTEKYVGVSSGTSYRKIKANWCDNCIDVENGKCSLNAKTPGKCTYTTSCNKGYYMSSGDKTFNPTCLSNSMITINYNENGGSEVENDYCEYNKESITLPDAPTKTGYNFAGWVLANGKIVDAGSVIECNKSNLGVSSKTSTSIKAKWSSDTITVNYNTDGGSNVNSTTCTYNSKLTITSEKPTKDGYTFNGWNLSGTNKASGSSIDKGCVTKYLGADNIINANWCENCANVENGTCTLNAKTVGKCTYTTSCNTGYYLYSGSGTAHPECYPNTGITVKYNSNNGSAVSNGFCNLNETLTLPEAPTREGYHFTGWKLYKGTASASETVACNKDTLGVTSKTSTAITAQWALNEITLDWNEAGGTELENGKCTYTKTITMPSAPTREGYAFAGFKLATGEVLGAKKSKDKACTKEYLGVTSGTSPYIKAIWCENCANVENGTCALKVSSTGKCTYTTTCNTGYESLDGGKYNSTCVLNTITLDWNEAGGTELENGKCTYTKELTLPKTVEREGYTFNGWLLADGKTKVNGGTTISEGCNKTNLGVIKGSTTKVKALWCNNCKSNANGTCTLDASTPGTCTYKTECNEGYKISKNGAYNYTCKK